jgi:chitodextrinase
VAALTGALLLLGVAPAQAALPRFAGPWKGTAKYAAAGGAQPKLGLGVKLKTEGDFYASKGRTVFNFGLGGGKLKMKRKGSSLRGTWLLRKCNGRGYQKDVTTVKATRTVTFEGVRYATALKGKLVARSKHCDGEFRSKTYTLKLKRPAPKALESSFLQDGEWKCGTGYVVSFQAQDDSFSPVRRKHVMKHDWSFGDGAALAGGSKEAASHTYAAPGNYAVSLTETLWDGSVGRKTEQLSVPPSDC